MKKKIKISKNSLKIYQLLIKKNVYSCTAICIGRQLLYNNNIITLDR